MNKNNKIVQSDKKVLRKKAKPVEKIDKEVDKIITKMKEILSNLEDAAALAAPQIGVSKQIVVIKKLQNDNFDIPEMVLINPKIVEKSGSNQEAEEGCLSLMEPEIRGTVSRAGQVTVKALNEKGEVFQKTAYGLLARIIQHELDHLKGKLFIDRAQPDTLHKANNKAKENDKEPKL